LREAEGGRNVLPSPNTTGGSGACAQDKNCKMCSSQGRCQRCQNAAYLLDGRCEPHAKHCAAAGLVPVGGQGDSTYGRACVRAGGVCRFESQQSCRSPKALGDCAASVVAPSKATCIECEKSAWLIGGVCKRRLTCGRGNVYEETGEPCNCNEALAAGGVAKTCKRCYAWRVPHPRGIYYINPRGVHTECSACKAPHLMHEGRCVAPAACPPAMARHLVGSMGGRCEAPFACVRGTRVGGDSSGLRCKCADRKLCRDCLWNAGSAVQQCTLCKKYTVLLDGECISVMDCIGMGRVPVQDGPQGGRCELSGGLGGKDG